MSRNGRRIVMLFIGAVALTACADRPSPEELTKAILIAAQQDDDITVTNDQAGCIADQLLEASDLSDTTLDGLAENFLQPVVLSVELDKVEPAVAEAYLACPGG